MDDIVQEQALRPYLIGDDLRDDSGDGLKAILHRARFDKTKTRV